MSAERDQLRSELRIIEEGYTYGIDPKKRKRALAIITILRKCICRHCGKHYDNAKARGEYKGFCSAKYHGYRKSNGVSEYKVLKSANDIGDVFVTP